MGKHKISKLFTGQPAPTESQDSWMRDLQLQTICVDPVRWARPRPSNWSHAFQRHTRPRRFR